VAPDERESVFGFEFEDSDKRLKVKALGVEWVHEVSRILLSNCPFSVHSYFLTLLFAILPLMWLKGEYRRYRGPAKAEMA